MSEAAMEYLLSTKKRYILLAFLAFLAVAGNYFGFSLVPGIEILFGGIAVLLIVIMFNPFWGTMVAFMSGLVIYSHFHHPYFLLVFTCEALFVGFAQRRKNINIVILDGAYWALFGIPVIWIVYSQILHVDNSIIILISLKCFINGLVNSIIAGMALAYLISTGKFAPQNEKNVTLHYLILNLLVSFVLVTTLIYTYTETQKDQKQAETDNIFQLEKESSQAMSHLMSWLQQHQYALSELAKITSENSISKPAEMQRSTEDFKRAYADFAAVSVCDPKGISVCYAPIFDQSGKSNIGQDFSDREYFKKVKETLLPYMSDVFLGRAGAPFSIAVISVPVVDRGSFRAVVTGGLNLDSMGQLLNMASFGNSMSATLLDRQGMIITSTHREKKPMQKFAFKPNGQVRDAGNGIMIWRPSDEFSAQETVKWAHEVYIKEVKGAEPFSWTLLFEIDTAASRAKIIAGDIKYLSILLLLLVIAILMAELVSRRISMPISSLAAITTGLPDRISQGSRQQDWPTSFIYEIKSLVANFSSMAQTLESNFEIINRQLAAMKISMDGISVINLQGKFLYMNDAHAYMYGYDNPEALIGKSWRKLFVEEEMTRFDYEILPEIALKKRWRGEATGKRKEGTSFPLEISINYIEGYGSVTVARDITDANGSNKCFGRKRSGRWSHFIP